MNIIKEKSKILLIAGLILMTGFAFAKDDDVSMPPGCKEVGYKFDLHVVEFLPEDVGERNSLYLVRNKLDKPVILNHMRDGDSYQSMHLNHMISAKRWAALSTNEKKLKYFCTIRDSKIPYGRIVDCKESIEICEYARVVFGLNNRGNVWIVGSNTRNGAVRGIVRYGIIPK